MAHSLLHANNKHVNDAVVAENLKGILSAKSLDCLHRRQWLSDEVVNAYMRLLQNKFPHVYAFNSFFWQKLSTNGTKYDFNGVSNWTRKKKIDIFSYDLVLIPLHVHNSHWALGAVDIKSKSIEYLDSRRDPPPENFFQYVKKYLKDELSGNTQDDIQSPRWIKIQYDNLPEQLNDNDCGLFMCLYATYLAAGMSAELVTREELTVMRQRMLVLFCKGEL